MPRNRIRNRTTDLRCRVCHRVAIPASIFISRAGFNDRARERSIHAQTCEADAREVRPLPPSRRRARERASFSLWALGFANGTSPNRRSRMPIIIPASSARDGWIGNRKIDDCVAISNCGGGDVSGGWKGGGLGNSPGTSRMTRVAPFEIAPDSYIGAEPPEKRERPPSLPRPAAIPFLPPDVPDVPSNPRGERSREIHPLYLSSDRPPPLGKTSLLEEECPPRSPPRTSLGRATELPSCTFYLALCPSPLAFGQIKPGF